MSIDETELIKYHNLCDPFETPQNDYNIDIDNEKDEEGNFIDSRGRRWAEHLAKQIRFATKDPACLFFSGHRGSGKTTELKRVKSRLEQDGYQVVYIDSEEFISLTSTIDVVDILSVIIYNTIKAVEGKDALQVGFFEEIMKLLKKDVDLEKVQADIGGNKLVFELKESEDLREIVRKSLSRTFLDFKRQAHTELTRLRKKAKDNGKKDLVVILDTMEKLRGLSSNWADVIQSAETVFGGHVEHLRIPLHIIYTVPPSFTLRERGDVHVEFLPVIKVVDRQGKGYSKGIGIAKKIIYSRLPEDFCRQVFGDKHGDIITDIIKFSGGYPRDMLQIVQKVLLSDSFPVSGNAIKKIKAEYTNQYKGIIAKDYDDILLEVNNTNELHVTRDDHYLAERLFETHVILRYSNDESWYSLHPAIKELPLFQDG